MTAGAHRLSLPILAAASVLLLWPAVLNGGPLFFYDSFAYLSTAREAVQALTGLDVNLAGFGDIVGGGTPADAAAASSEPTEAPYAGRSVFYGLPLFALAAIGSPMAAIVAQALLFAIALFLVARALTGDRIVDVAASLFVVAVLTPAPFFVSYLMPDFLTGLTILALTRLIAIAAPLSRWEFLFWTGVLAFGVLAHISHLALTAAIAAVAVVMGAALRGVFILRPARAAAIGLSLVAGVAGEMVFSFAVQSVYGASPLRPPILAARLIDDGPGYRLMSTACEKSEAYAYCAYLDRLPVGSDTFLWNRDPAVGVYAPATVSDKRAMSDDQARFVVDVVRHYPVEQAAASLRRFSEQATRYSLSEFHYTDQLRALVARNVSGDAFEVISETRLYRGSFPLDVMNAVSGLVILAAFGLCALTGASECRRRGGGAARDDRRDDFIAACLIIAAGLALNAAITGALAVPHDRYQARVIWLAPFVGTIAAFRLARRRMPAPASRVLNGPADQPI